MFNELDFDGFCAKCGWDDPDYGCIVPTGEEVYQCPLYIHFHPEEVEKFNKDMEKWVNTKKGV